MYKIWNGIENLIIVYESRSYEMNYYIADTHFGHVHESREEKLFQDVCKNIAETTDIPMNCFNVGCMLPYMNYTPRTLKEILI